MSSDGCLWALHIRFLSIFFGDTKNIPTQHKNALQTSFRHEPWQRRLAAVVVSGTCTRRSGSQFSSPWESRLCQGRPSLSLRRWVRKVGKCHLFLGWDKVARGQRLMCWLGPRPHALLLSTVSMQRNVLSRVYGILKPILISIPLMEIPYLIWVIYFPYLRWNFHTLMGYCWLINNSLLSMWQGKGFLSLQVV